MAAYRKWFEKGTADHPMTSKQAVLLKWIASMQVLTTRQLAGLTGSTESAVGKLTRNLFDLGLLDCTAVGHPALTATKNPNHTRSPGPKLHFLTKEGRDRLIRSGMMEKEEIRDFPDYGPNNAYFLAHELLAKDTRVWLETAARAHGHGGVGRWIDGPAAHILPARPDAWFTYQAGEAWLVGLVEADRGTEKSPSTWEKKFWEYRDLFRGSGVLEATGKERARIIVTVPEAARREKLGGLLGALLPKSGMPPDRFWIADMPSVWESDLYSPIWRVPGKAVLQPLVSPGHFSDAP